MHRIDGPGATVDNKFTDGDPVGGIQATLVTDDWLNDVQENIMAVLVAAAVSPTKGRSADLVDAIRSISPGAVGSVRNAKMSLVAASASATFTSDQVVVASSLGGATYRLSSFSKIINLATIGAGGMDTGSAPLSGFVGLYAIYNPSNGASALLAVNATSALLPNVYGGASMPAGYTASALISVWGTNGSGQFVIGLQVDREISIATNTVFTTTTVQASLTSFSISAVVPRNAVTCRGDYTVGSSAASAGASAVLCGSPIEIGRVAQGGTSATAGATMVSSFPHLPILTAQTLYYRGSVSAGTYNFVVSISSYVF